ncbi:MAG: hypothetical protein Fur0023_19610 [Bacteroidia bacterium]
MAVFRFKVYWEENADVERIILIKSNQTFFDFYNIIIESFRLNNKDVSASFFTSDDYWDKYTEITLKQEDVREDEKLMDRTSIASMVEHPKQKFVFVYDEQLQLTLHIELIKMEADNENEVYPKVISAKNEIPKRKKTRQKNNLPTSSDSINTATSLSDDEIDKLIYSNLMKGDISEEDILNGNIENMLKSNLKSNDIELSDDYEEEDESDENEKFFDEEDDFYDDDDYDENTYFDTDGNDEN